MQPLYEHIRNERGAEKTHEVMSWDDKKLSKVGL